MTPRLTPLYDQVSTVAWTRPDRKLALKWMGAREFGDINRESVTRLATKLGHSPKKAIELALALLAKLKQAWPDIATGTGLAQEHRVAIEGHWGRVPLLREAGSLA